MSGDRRGYPKNNAPLSARQKTSLVLLAKKGFPYPAYPETICRNKFKRTIAGATIAQIWKLKYDVDQRKPKQPCGCAVHIYSLAGLKAPCDDACAKNLSRVRSLLDWQPFGDFFMSSKLTPGQHDDLLDQINKAKKEAAENE